MPVLAVHKDIRGASIPILLLYPKLATGALAFPKLPLPLDKSLKIPPPLLTPTPALLRRSLAGMILLNKVPALANFSPPAKGNNLTGL